MQADIFSSTPNWSYSSDDEKAEAKLGVIQKETISNLPKNYYTGNRHFI